MSWKRNWAKNFSRTLVCVGATILALKFEGKIKGTKKLFFPDTSTPPSNFLLDSDYYYHDSR